MKKRISAGLWMALFVCLVLGLGWSGTALSSDLQGRISFFPAVEADEGDSPQISINNNNAFLSVHQGNVLKSLNYQFGYVLKNGTMRWWHDSKRYSMGRDPSIAIADPITDGGTGYFLEVHCSTDDDNLLYCMTGSYDATNGTIKWRGEQLIPNGKGVRPRVTMDNEGNVVLVYWSKDPKGLYYYTGKFDLDQGTITWKQSNGIQYQSDGEYPAIAMVRNGSGDTQRMLVEVHESDSGDRLKYRVGQLDTKTWGINWSDAGTQEIDQKGGVHPSVGITDAGQVIAIHKSQNYTTLWYHQGKIDLETWTIPWGNSIHFDNGAYGSIALSNTFAVEVHQSSPTNKRLWYSDALIIDYSRWMEAQRDIIGNRPFYQITFPGTHDATMYMTHDIIIDSMNSMEEKWPFRSWIRENWIETQEDSIFDQLKGGVRYFDFRPAWYDKTLYFLHSFAGPEIPVVFTDLMSFLKNAVESENGELIVLVWSHFYKFDADGYAALNELIDTCLKDYLYTAADPENTNLMETTFNEYTRVNGKSVPKILFLVESGDYKDWEDSGHPPPEGVWPYQDMGYKDSTKPVTGSMRIINDYADSDHQSTMRSDQTKKLLSDKGGNQDRAFLLSWTLTAPGDWKWWTKRYTAYTSDGKLADKHPENIRDMASSAKGYLQDFIWTYYGVHKLMINVVYTDYYNDAATPALAYLMNNGNVFDPAGAPPNPGIQANGGHDAIVLEQGAPLSITVGLDAGYRKNLKSDLWIAVNTPWGWYSYVKSVGWAEGLVPYEQAPLTDVPVFEVPALQRGTGHYTYYFGVDGNSDGICDPRWIDQVDVDITRWR